MSSVGRKCTISHHFLTAIVIRFLVGAMFYLSPTLTLLMLAVVPPVSLGAVRLHVDLACKLNIESLSGFLWSLLETVVQ